MIYSYGRKDQIESSDTDIIKDPAKLRYKYLCPSVCPLSIGNVANSSATFHLLEILNFYFLLSVFLTLTFSIFDRTFCLLHNTRYFAIFGYNRTLVLFLRVIEECCIKYSCHVFQGWIFNSAYISHYLIIWTTCIFFYKLANWLFPYATLLLLKILTI